MLVQSERNKGTQTAGGGGGNSAPEPAGVSLKDSPLLARVRRAMLRQEEEERRKSHASVRSPYVQSLLAPMYDKETAHAIKRGLLWHQRDRLFSRWKERYFILTRDYLHCFRRASGSDRISEMGQFLLKIKLVDIEKVEWENKKTYSTVVLNFGRDGRIFLRSPDRLEEWFELLEECTLTSKERRRALRQMHDGSQTRDSNYNTHLDDWLAGRQKLPMGRLQTDTMSTRQGEYSFLRKRDWTPRDEDWDNPSLDNRLSLLTDIDINGYDDSTLEAPSITSFRLNEDVLCIQPPSLRPSGSFRSNRDSTANSTKEFSTKKNVPSIQDTPSPLINFRERSYSDIQRVDKRHWRPLLSIASDCKFN